MIRTCIALRHTQASPLEGGDLRAPAGGAPGRVDLAHLQEFPIYFLSRCPRVRELCLRDVNLFHIDMWFEPDPELVSAHAHGELLPRNELRVLELRMKCNLLWSFVHDVWAYSDDGQPLPPYQDHYRAM